MKALKVCKVSLGCKVMKVRKAYKVCKVMKARKVCKVYKGYKVMKVYKARKVCKAYKVRKVCKVMKARKVCKVMRARKAYKVRKVYKVCKVMKAPEGLQGALKDLAVLKTCRSHFTLLLIDPSERTTHVLIRQTAHPHLVRQSQGLQYKQCLNEFTKPLTFIPLKEETLLPGSNQK